MAAPAPITTRIMHWLDITILVVLGAGAAMGFCSGLLWQVARVVSLAVSLYVGILTNTAVADWLAVQWKDASPAFNRIAAFIAVFLLVYLILYLVTRLIHKAINGSIGASLKQAGASLAPDQPISKIVFDGDK